MTTGATLAPTASNRRPPVQRTTKSCVAGSTWMRDSMTTPLGSPEPSARPGPRNLDQRPEAGRILEWRAFHRAPMASTIRTVSKMIDAHGSVAGSSSVRKRSGGVESTIAPDRTTSEVGAEVCGGGLGEPTSFRALAEEEARTGGRQSYCRLPRVGHARSPFLPAARRQPRRRHDPG
jgi:hypothetical protein